MGGDTLFIKYMGDKSVAVNIAQTSVFKLTRAILIGAMGAGAAFLGSLVLGFQNGM